MKKLLTAVFALSMGTMMFAGPQAPAQKPTEPAPQSQPGTMKKHKTKKVKTHKEKTPASTPEKK